MEAQEKQPYLCGDCRRVVSAEERAMAEEVLGSIPDTLLLHWLCSDCSEPDLINDEGERIAQWVYVS